MSVKDDLTKFKERIIESLEQLTSTKELGPIATDTAEIIRRRTRLGSGVESTGAAKSPLAKLKQSTIAARTRKKKQGKLSDKTSPKKSNLTDTSEMLESLQGRAINGLISVAPTGERNKRVAGYAIQGSATRPKRKFLDLGKEDIKQVQVKLQDRFIKILDSVFRKK